MKILSTLLIIIASFSYSVAQVALTTSFVSQASEAPGGISGGLIPVNSSGYELGLGYWFRLKSKRMEFTPEISYSSLKGESGLGDITGFNFNANIFIYALDFHSDCNSCPTFSKEGGTVKKGFHWIITPTVYHYTFINDESSTNVRLSLGAGLDLGITNLLTLTPYATYGLAGKEDFYGNPTNRPKQLHLGLRSTLRFDKNKW